MEHEVEDNLIRDLSELEHGELVRLIVEDFQASEVDFVLPNIRTDYEPLTILHNRFQRMQDVPSLKPEVIEDKILTGLRSLYPYTGVEDSLDQAVNRRGTALFKGKFNNGEFGLSKAEQLLFARGVLIATSSRIDSAIRQEKEPSSNQKKLQKASLSFVKHIMTNPVRVPKNGSVPEQERFISSYLAAYLAKCVYEENMIQGSYQTKSITTAMALPISFGLLLSGDEQERVSIFNEGDVGRDPADSSEDGFVQRHPAEIDEKRIKDLRKLQNSFGDEVTRFRYFESVKVFVQNNLGPKTPDPDKNVQPRKSALEHNPSENYIVLTIEQPQDDGSILTHAIAENNEKGNACYGLRHEVLDEWERLLGVRMTWRDIFSAKRTIVRQIGGKVFVHNVGSDVPARVNEYLNLDSDMVIYETFSRIFNNEAGLFDENMNPTSENIMPTYLLEMINRSQVLKDLWPSIHSYGYAQTYRMLRGIELSASRQKTQSSRSPEKTLSLVQKAQQLITIAAQRDEQDRLDKARAKLTNKN